MTSPPGAGRTGFLLVLPALFVLCALSAYPVLYGVWLSFFDKHSIFPGERFIGITNYLAVFVDEEFWRSVWLGTVYAGSTIVLQLVVGVGAALALNEAFPGRNVLRAIVIFPYIIPTVVGAPGYFIGMMVYQQQGTAGNMPLAAAFSIVPIVLIAIYLALARRMGAFDAL